MLVVLIPETGGEIRAVTVPTKGWKSWLTRLVPPATGPAHHADRAASSPRPATLLGRCLVRRLSALSQRFASVDESADRLHRAGWSMGELLTAGGWLITAINGENV